ncbi:MAG: hypothetical protein JWO67_5374 [Streptosporangiaceae bacterium]|nr:hypothetical protein [Streptosporangiaceae bacterium]
MAEGLATADGERIDIDTVEQEFARAMAAPLGTDPEAPSPPDVGLVDPEAPYGYTVDGRPKKGPGGRPPRDKARTTNAPKALSGSQKPSDGPKGKTQPATAATYAAGLSEFLAGIELALAVLPIPKDDVRVHARYQSAVLEQTGDGLAKGVGMWAEHNGMVRWCLEMLTKGGGAWVFPAAMAIAPFAVSTAMLWKAPVTDEMRAGADKIEADTMARLKAEMGLDELAEEQVPQAA